MPEAWKGVTIDLTKEADFEMDDNPKPKVKRKLGNLGKLGHLRKLGKLGNLRKLG